MIAHHRLRIGAGDQVDDPAHVPDQRHLGTGHDDLECHRGGKDLAERSGIVAQKGQQPRGRCVLFLIGRERIDKVLEEPEHDGPFGWRAVRARLMADQLDG